MEISVSFVSDSIVLDERSKRILDAARKKNNFLIVIEGDCTLSTTGNTNLNNLVDKNKELAMKRANAVDEYLIKLGVPKNHIKIISSCERKLQTIKIDEKAAH